MILAPDEIQQEFCTKQKSLQTSEVGNAADFKFHGFNIHGIYQSSCGCRCFLMCAPKGPGHLVRRNYEEGFGVPALYAVYQDATGNAKNIWTGVKAVGAVVVFLKQLIKKKLKKICLVTRYFVCFWTALSKQVRSLNRSRLRSENFIFILKFFHENEINRWPMKVDSKMRQSISNTAEYGICVSGPRVITEQEEKWWKLSWQTSKMVNL